MADYELRIKSSWDSTIGVVAVSPRAKNLYTGPPRDFVAVFDTKSEAIQWICACEVLGHTVGRKDLLAELLK